MSDSILNNVKKYLGIDEAYDGYDEDITMHINSAFATLNQLGIGPTIGYEITSDSDTWVDFYGENLRYRSVKQYVYLKVRLAFDPPPTSFAIDAVEKQIKELEWRLNRLREDTEWVPQLVYLDETLILDGGEP